MVKQNGLKLKRIAWIGFIILVLVVGLGPLAMLITFTWEDNQGLGGFLDRLRLDYRNSGRPVDPIHEEPLPEPYMVQYLYRYCGHSAVYLPDNIPAEYPEPPRAIAEIAVALHNSNLSVENFMGELKTPTGWTLADINDGLGRTFFMLTHLADLCSRCAGRYFLGIFNEKIAVFQGIPPAGKLMEITEIQVKEIDRKDLENGVIFENEDQKKMLLESFSS